MKYYPDNRDKVDQLRWLSLKRDDSFAVRNHWLIGGRGFGKTYRVKLEKCLKNFQKTGNTFFWARTTDTALDNIRDPVQFFGRIKPEDLKALEIEKYDIRDDKIYINKRRCGYLFAVSTFYNNKGADYDCQIGVWDEFMRAKGERPLQGKYEKFMDLCQSVLRDSKNSQVYGISNSTNQFDEVMAHYHWKKQGFGVYLYREQNALIHYIAPSQRFIDAQKDSTSFAGMSDFQKKMTYQNEFTDYGDYDKVSKTRYLFTIQADDDLFISFYDGKSKLYCKSDMPDKAILRAVDASFVNNKVNKLSTTEKKYLMQQYERGNVLFIDGYSRTTFNELFY